MNPAEAYAFAAAAPTICKPLGDGVLKLDGQERVFFTQQLGPGDVEALLGLGPEPYLLQRLIDKRFDVRVVVIGTELFAVRIHSQDDDQSRVDWRRGDAASLPHHPIELPGTVARRCLELVRGYGLAFGALDLACDVEGSYVFFEINPSGQWAWLEQLTGIPLRSRLATLLIDGGAGD